MPLGAILGLIARFIPDPDQREKAVEAARQAYANFIMATNGPLYSACRMLIILASMWDLFLNHGAAFARTADTMQIPRATAGLMELAVIVWLFVGDAVVGPLAGALGHAFDAAAQNANKSTAGKANGDNGSSRDGPGDRG